jgi:Na+-translocating ferredoxin:NAD+ oxidoreductase RnfG subunit
VRQNWQLIVMVACLMLMAAGTSAGIVLFVTQEQDAHLASNQQASCERGNLLRRLITGNVQADRDGWKIARQARAMAAKQATNHREIVINATAAEGYRGVIDRLHGIDPVDCRLVIR